jgi:pimeloyl-ACP methyl ester carboxylesterase
LHSELFIAYALVVLSPISPRIEAPHAYLRSIEFLPKRTISYRTSRNTDSSPDRVGVFLHGLGGSSLNWTDLMLALEPQLTGYAIDLPGFGMSPPPRDGDYTPSGHARAVAEFILAKDLGPVDLFGNSLGGAVALQLAARKPELVRSLTVISPAFPSLYATKGNVHLPAIAFPGVGERLIPKYFEMPPEDRVQATIDGCTARPDQFSKIRMAEAVEEVRERDHFTYNTDAFLRSLRGLFRTNADLIGANRPWKLAERVTAPTLAIYGREDVLVSAKTAHRFTKHFPNAHVVVLPDTGHMAQSEHPEFVKAAWDRFLL